MVGILPADETRLETYGSKRMLETRPLPGAARSQSIGAALSVPREPEQSAAFTDCLITAGRKRQPARPEAWRWRAMEPQSSLPGP